MKQQVIESEFWLGDIVFLKINEQRLPGMVTSIGILGNGSLIFNVTWEGMEETKHFAIEITFEFTPPLESVSQEQ